MTAATTTRSMTAIEISEPGDPGVLVPVERAQDATLAEPGRIRLPILFVIPEDDAVVDSEVTKSFARRVSDDRKQLCVLPEFRHEPHLDLGREELFQTIGGWLEDRIRDAS